MQSGPGNGEKGAAMWRKGLGFVVLAVTVLALGIGGGDTQAGTPPGQGVAAAIELLKAMETFAPKMRAMDRLAVRTALKLLQPM